MSGQPPIHIYLSTACLHGEHTYCQARAGLVGTKLPAQCKFCSALCVCPCHEPVDTGSYGEDLHLGRRHGPDGGER